MFYEKKVRYLDFYRNGERVRNGGFARTEIRGERFRLELTLKGVSAAGRTAGSVILCAGKRNCCWERWEYKTDAGNSDTRKT